jgi:transcriptional regulator with XRE-family HTH domain
MNIGEYVRQQKELRGLTLEQMYVATGIRPGHLSRLMTRPPQNPDVDTVEKLARAFRIPAPDIWRAISSDALQSQNRVEQAFFAQLADIIEPLDPAIQRALCVHLRDVARSWVNSVVDKLHVNPLLTCSFFRFLDCSTARLYWRKGDSPTIAI